AISARVSSRRKSRGGRQFRSKSSSLTFAAARAMRRSAAKSGSFRSNQSSIVSNRSRSASEPVKPICAITSPALPLDIGVAETRARAEPLDVPRPRVHHRILAGEQGPLAWIPRLPHRPDAVHLAMVHPEDGVARGGRHIVHGRFERDVTLIVGS